MFVRVEGRLYLKLYQSSTHHVAICARVQVSSNHYSVPLILITTIEMKETSRSVLPLIRQVVSDDSSSHKTITSALTVYHPKRLMTRYLSDKCNDIIHFDDKKMGTIYQCGNIHSIISLSCNFRC